MPLADLQKAIMLRCLAGLALLICLDNGRAFAAHVLIAVGDDLQAAVTANPAGAIFRLAAGVHRHQYIVPKDGNTFEGDPGAIMSGARLLTAFTIEGDNYVASGQTQQGQVNGICVLSYEGCWYPEDLFFDDVPLWHVRTLGEVAPGTWFFDYVADKIYFRDDPTGRKVETSVTRHAFVGNQTNVTIRGLIIEKYASAGQFGTIHARDYATEAPSTNWVIEHCEILLNHSAGIRTGNGTKILNNFIHDNGQIGIEGAGDDVLIEGNEISYNNFAGFTQGFEAGGAKMVQTQRLTVRNNFVHHNKGPGLWTDGNNIYTVYENNRVIENEDIGIFHEISYDAVIRNNTVKHNGQIFDDWLYGAQIMISTSQSVQVYQNTVEVHAANGNGITIVQQDRGGTGAHGYTGPWVAINNAVHRNVITYLGDQGQSGMAADHNPNDVFVTGNNLFDYNTYHAPHLDYSRWAWGSNKTWTAFQAAGQEANGTADTVLSTPTKRKRKVWTAGAPAP